jgi:hypothetical protein
MPWFVRCVVIVRRGCWFRWPALLGVGVALALLGTLCVLVMRGGGAAGARSLPRGPVVSVPNHPSVLARAAVVTTLNRARGQAKVPVLARSRCLERAAASLVGSFGSGRTPTAAPGGCGPVQWGWVAGKDWTGAQQARVAYGRTPAGPSPLIGKSVRQLGLALGPQSGVLTGYVLVWVVSR